ncbi:MAG: alpha/beta hydrolase [Bacteroidota bacterium]
MAYLLTIGIFVFFGLIILLVHLYLDEVLLPPSLPEVPENLVELEAWIVHTETKASTRPDNEARIVWADGHFQKKTPYSIVYLHGFSASQGEGHPVHQSIAAEFGCNLFLARLQAHGLEAEEPLINMHREGLVKSAAEALAIGKRIGEKVILMSTSTGGSLSLILSSFFPGIAGQILYSPNIRIKNPAAFLLGWPGGIQFARWAFKGNRKYSADVPNPYWYDHVHIRSLLALHRLLKTYMQKRIFRQIHCPTLMLYYFKNKREQDQVVSVPAMLKMFRQLGTQADHKQAISLPKAGVHAIASDIYSQDIDGVIRHTRTFCQGVIQLPQAETH